ncbi:hypothetical protein ACS0TY_030503 [Phlomoides rotata]
MIQTQACPQHIVHSLASKLNSYTNEEKVELVQFHVLLYYLSLSQFQTASNPLTTQAGSSSQLFAMKVTAIGNQVNITTRETNATLVNTTHTDNQVAVYEVDKVLLPLRFYVPRKLLRR